MGRALCLDVGTKRTGVAVSDINNIIASPLETVATNNLIDWIKNYINKEPVSQLVVGSPLNLDNTPSESAQFIDKTVKKIQQIMPKTITTYRIDERFSSKMAKASLLQAGAKKKTRQNKAIIDKISAAIILQDFIDQQK